MEFLQGAVVDFEPLTDEAVRLLSLFDPELLKECEIKRYQASGPGGQKRNRVYSAVRIVHTGSGISVTAASHRESARNQNEAVEKLRLALALSFNTRGMQEADVDGFPIVCPPGWPVFRSKVNAHSRHYPNFVYLSLCGLKYYRGHIGDCALSLGVSTSALIRLFKQHKQVWQTAQDIRELYGLGPLK